MLLTYYIDGHQLPLILCALESFHSRFWHFIKSCDCTLYLSMASGWTLSLLILWTAVVLSITAPNLSPRQSNSSALAEPYLHGLAQAQGKLWFGTATDVYGASGEHDNADYMAVLNSSAIFGQLTPMNHMKVSLSSLAFRNSPN